MDRAELLVALREDYGGDWERAHACHDAALLAYIGDPEVTEVFNSQTKWYA